jgi:hypothetical protein
MKRLLIGFIFLIVVVSITFFVTRDFYLTRIEILNDDFDLNRTELREKISQLEGQKEGDELVLSSLISDHEDEMSNLSQNNSRNIDVISSYVSYEFIGKLVDFDNQTIHLYKFLSTEDELNYYNVEANPNGYYIYDMDEEVTLQLAYVTDVFFYDTGMELKYLNINSGYLNLNEMNEIFEGNYFYITQDKKNKRTLMVQMYLP